MRSMPVGRLRKRADLAPRFELDVDFGALWDFPARWLAGLVGTVLLAATAACPGPYPVTGLASSQHHRRML